jgi:mono/diheme cytochrome c family protein
MRPSTARFASALVMLAALARLAAADAAEGGDPARGLTYAKQVCAKCHAVEQGDMYSPELLAPTFETVAKTPGMTERALYVWLQAGNHEEMPNLIIAPGDLDGVVAYIMSLRTSGDTH